LAFCVVAYQVEDMDESVMILLLLIRWQRSVLLEPMKEYSACLLQQFSDLQHTVIACMHILVH
jgi:hypothetical protein